MKPIIEIKELSEIISNEDLVLIDSRYKEFSYHKFEKEHLPNAQYVNLDVDLAHIKEDVREGGRHPLPEVKDFQEVIRKLGITNSSHIVIYDDNGGAFASRMWWMLRSVGLKKVQVLNGGFSQAKDSGLIQTSSQIMDVKASAIEISSFSWPQTEMQDILNKELDEVVIDVREVDRYSGKNEPIDLIAGHIPSAVNYPFANHLDQKGFFKPQSEIREMYEHVTNSPITVHCGSGVTACHTILAFEYAGLVIPNLYVGSWSEWSRNDNPMITL